MRNKELPGGAVWERVQISAAKENGFSEENRIDTSNYMVYNIYQMS